MTPWAFCEQAFADCIEIEMALAKTFEVANSSRCQHRGPFGADVRQDRVDVRNLHGAA